MRMSISGSTILSDSGSLHRLFTPFNNGVEIGLLENDAAWEHFLSLAGQHLGVAWGLHFPRLRVHKPIQNDLAAAQPDARKRLGAILREDAKRVEGAGGEYVLVHFPFFASSAAPLATVRDTIWAGVEELHQVAGTLAVPLVIEFKLGRHRDPGGLRYVIELGDSLLDALEPFGCCIDVGDWSIAAMQCKEAEAVFRAWLARATHIHLHGVALLDDGKYFWTPVGPEATLPVEGWELESLVRRFYSCSGAWAVCEHTPHMVQGDDQVVGGYRWLQGLIDELVSASDAFAGRKE